MLKLYKVN